MSLTSSHPDFPELEPVRSQIEQLLAGGDDIHSTFPSVVASAVDYVLDPVRTGRTLISELDNVEKTIIGLKVEHFVRDWLGVPPGIRDLNVRGYDVDVKNTVGRTWMIPPETINEESRLGGDRGGICLLIRIDEAANRCWLGLMRVRQSYLNKPNRDGKCSVKAAGMKNIMWLVSGAPYQAGHWSHFDMKRFRELRDLKGGNNRVVKFFSENVRKPVHRSVILALLHDQLDPMKRVRSNGGAKERLWAANIAILSGAYFRIAAADFGIASLRPDQFVSVTLTEAEKLSLERYGYMSAKDEDASDAAEE